MKPHLAVAQVSDALGVHLSVAYREIHAHMKFVVLGVHAIRVP